MFKLSWDGAEGAEIFELYMLVRRVGKGNLAWYQRVSTLAGTKKTISVGDGFNTVFCKKKVQSKNRCNFFVRYPRVLIFGYVSGYPRPMFWLNFHRKSPFELRENQILPQKSFGNSDQSACVRIHVLP